MRTEFKVEFVKPKYVTPSQLLMIACIMLGSFALASIPIILSMGNYPTDPVPNEATLWAVVKEK